MDELVAAGRRLEYRLIPGDPERATLVFLHEGLGSAGLWRAFPDRVAAATGRPALVYSRYGYGGSDILREPRDPGYIHREAEAALPEVLARLGIRRPVLVGHSDGASIALLHAAAGHPAAGLVLMAPHVFVEEETIRGIAETTAAFHGTDLPARLGRHHADAARTFHGWSDIWLSPAFRDWNIEAALPGVRCPLLLIQGEDDEYATLAQLDAIERGVPGPVERLVLADCRHSPQREQEDATLAAIVRFVDGLS